ncbi:Uncharacterised protein [Slackia heliotrinireducens]|nr:Uncharacterised protein [Slackia heliotrinireducens]
MTGRRHLPAPVFVRSQCVAVGSLGEIPQGEIARYQKDDDGSGHDGDNGLGSDLVLHVVLKGVAHVDHDMDGQTYHADSHHPAGQEFHHAVEGHAVPDAVGQKEDDEAGEATIAAVSRYRFDAFSGQKPCGARPRSCAASVFRRHGQVSCGTVRFTIEGSEQKVCINQKVPAKRARSRAVPAGLMAVGRRPSRSNGYGIWIRCALSPSRSSLSTIPSDHGCCRCPTRP